MSKRAANPARRRVRPEALVLRAPAKVNLYLRVVGRRQDGYHLIESLMVPVSLADRVSLRQGPRNEISLRCSDPRLPQTSDNLAWRAADLLRQHVGRRDGVEIRLVKRIPAGAGLGGGSSDAAAVLVGLNRLWGLDLPVKRLSSLAARLGADVPFFVHGHPAVVRGIGDRVRPCKSFRGGHLVLVWPGFPIDTRWVYQNLHWSPPRRPEPSPLPPFLAGRRSLADIIHNDLEPVAVAAHPRILRIRHTLERLGATGARMTGSGSGVFGVFPSRGAARRVASTIRRTGLWAVAVRTLDESPAIAPSKPRRKRRIR